MTRLFHFIIGAFFFLNHRTQNIFPVESFFARLPLVCMCVTVAFIHRTKHVFGNIAFGINEYRIINVS